MKFIPEARTALLSTLKPATLIAFEEGASVVWGITGKSAQVASNEWTVAALRPASVDAPAFAEHSAPNDAQVLVIDEWIVEPDFSRDVRTERSNWAPMKPSTALLLDDKSKRLVVSVIPQMGRGIGYRSLDLNTGELATFNAGGFAVVPHFRIWIPTPSSGTPTSGTGPRLIFEA